MVAKGNLHQDSFPSRPYYYSTYHLQFSFTIISLFQDVIRLETQYWSLVEIPRQEKAETVPAFVLRACAIMEKTQKSGEGVKTSSKLAEEAADKRERIERLNGNVESTINMYYGNNTEVNG